TIAMKRQLNKFSIGGITAALICGGFLLSPTRAANGVQKPADKPQFIDVIVQTDAAPEAVAAEAEALGGEVHIIYRNVRALAASIPADQLGALTKASGVTKIEKDRIVRAGVFNTERPFDRGVDFAHHLQPMRPEEIRN